ncbi:TOMM precursor leader peptide-binding protein [Paenibacillus sp. P25]|nr:TOMM precursor leader peptide-binding protein [Paenibacillus sp. P25]
MNADGAGSPVQFSHTVGRIGPLIVPDETCCYACYELRLQSNGASGLTQRPQVFDLSQSLVLGIVSLEIVKWLSRDKNTFLPLTLEHSLEFDAFYLQGDLQPVYRVPSCPVCGARSKPEAAPQSWMPGTLAR